MLAARAANWTRRPEKNESGATKKASTRSRARAAKAAFKVAAAIQAGKWKKAVQADNWVGYPVAKALGLDLTNKADRAKVRHLLEGWIGTGKLVVVNDTDADQRRNQGVCRGSARGCRRADRSPSPTRPWFQL